MITSTVTSLTWICKNTTPAQCTTRKRKTGGHQNSCLFHIFSGLVQKRAAMDQNERAYQKQVSFSAAILYMCSEFWLKRALTYLNMVFPAGGGERGLQEAYEEGAREVWSSLLQERGPRLQDAEGGHRG